jgi:hypothetical protein
VRSRACSAYPRPYVHHDRLSHGCIRSMTRTRPVKLACKILPPKLTASSLQRSQSIKIGATGIALDRTLDRVEQKRPPETCPASADLSTQSFETRSTVTEPTHGGTMNNLADQITSFHTLLSRSRLAGRKQHARALIKTY